MAPAIATTSGSEARNRAIASIASSAGIGADTLIAAEASSTLHLANTITAAICMGPQKTGEARENFEIIKGAALKRRNKWKNKIFK